MYHLFYGVLWEKSTTNTNGCRNKT
jgi:hypothetical protein